MNTEQKIKGFFDAYRNRFTRALKGQDDINGTADSFAECFVSANPSGIFCGANNAEFREAIPNGNRFYRDIGTRSMDIDHIEITQLNSVHFMAKVFWKSAYDKNGKAIQIDFQVIYLLQQRNDDFKIFAYITEDEQKALREHGLLPDAGQSA